jgi:hypothetical protein
VSTQNPTEKGPEIPVIQPICPACGEPLKGINVAGMKLPIPGPDGKTVEFMNFMVPCCPNLECGIALAVQYMGNEPVPAPGAAAGLWTPPGSH